MNSTVPQAARPNEPPADDARDEQLARLIDQLLDDARQGRGVDIDAESRRHPELAADLRALWAAAAIARELGQSAHRKSATDSPPNAAVVGDAEARDGLMSSTGQGRQVGDFELVEEAGRGGMGVVYRARQLSLDRTVALKMIRSGEMASAADVARFRSEAEAAARLDHPNIVPLYAVNEHDGRPYFTMKWVDGTTLARRLIDGPLAPRDAAAILAPVCRAIHFAHQHGVLHRDLKPSNILIDRAGQPHVTDFGLAKRLPVGQAFQPDSSAPRAELPVRLESLTYTGAIIGTPSYMPPEQAAGNRGQLGAASDVYSLGAILYHMLTGRPPFQAASIMDTLLQVLEQDPAPPRVVNPQADRELELIALKCLQKPTDLRYASAAALADDLEAYLAGEPISARSGKLGAVISRAFRETHHAAVLENWGLLWMWHSLALIVLCVATDALRWQSIESRWPYVAFWTLGLGTWACIFWWLRRRGGPVTFVERQIAHVWGASMAASGLLFGVEWLLDMRVLQLAPVLALIGGASFVVKAGILSGTFYFQAVALFLTAGLMCRFPDVSVSIYGLISAACFFVPGLKYHSQRIRGGRTQ